jgi:hypothetical protein
MSAAADVSSRHVTEMPKGTTFFEMDQLLTPPSSLTNEQTAILFLLKKHPQNILALQTTEEIASYLESVPLTGRVDFAEHLPDKFCIKEGKRILLTGTTYKIFGRAGVDLDFPCFDKKQEEKKRGVKRAREEEEGEEKSPKRAREDCVVCLNAMDRTPIEVLPCRHKIHTICYKGILHGQGAKSCPLCREPFVLTHVTTTTPAAAPPITLLERVSDFVMELFLKLI